MLILLIEDNTDDETLTIRSLQQHVTAHEVHVVRDAAEAMAYLLATDTVKPRLILLDLKLPRFDGLQLLSQLKSDERTRRIPVVVLTSSREESDIQRSYDLGANSFIVKPVDYREFSEVVSRLGYYWVYLNEPAN
jgi:two-component system response regulator